MNQTHPVTANVPNMGAPVSGMYTMPEQEHQSQTTPKRILQVRGIKGLSITLVVMSCLLGILGIIAIIIEARRSYVGDPIWSGLGVLLITSILGLLVYYKRYSLCMNVAFIVMTGISAVWQFQLFIWMISAAIGDHYRTCNPAFDYESSFWRYDAQPCQFPNYSRITVDGITALIAFVSMVLCVILFSLTMYATLYCCHACNCCKTSSSSAEYLPYSSVMMVPMTVQSDQGQVLHQNPSTSQPMVAGSVPQSSNPQPLVVAGSPFQSTMVQPTPQPVLIQGSGSTISQPVVAAGKSPHSTISQPVLFAGSPHMSIIPQPGVVGGLPTQMSLGQQVVVAGSVPQPTNPQPLVVAGSTPQSINPQPLVVAGSTPQSTNAQPTLVEESVPVQHKNQQEPAMAIANNTHTAGAQASNTAAGSMGNQPQSWETFQ